MQTLKHSLVIVKDKLGKRFELIVQKRCTLVLRKCYSLATPCILYTKYKESCKQCIYSWFISLD